MAKEYPRSQHSSRVPNASAPQTAPVAQAPDANKPSGMMGETQSLTKHHGSVGSEMASRMPSDRVADITKTPSD